jgi:cytochrome c
MKSRISLLAAAAAALMVSLPAAAAPDADAAQKLAKDSGCTKCHSVDKSKKGPSYQKIAAKYKGKGDAVTVVTDQITKAPKVKFADGSEDTHDVVESKDPAAIKNLVEYILAQ